ncbi:Inhibitor of sigma-G Gin [Alkalithermobacter thermoalcaliphilus JW-YL-7 = DSM 7308]|uniref:Inhibitor of sigma-G Gin n=1 Tax=Alkalithermobacter thermoalcaliphilus JW-YL-7 = DSM 7308 TaxID=1121328 RepID=A0A150FUC2_CLOPD|nr:Sigma-G inhibitor, Gin [[Clostridium] paradoxum JW-YL-7 = DSM 7308]SHL20146.1 Inhibitor of sigma-G Gin [[Clostridium] paradoxum JW-YL-7 = DSM 7308]
MLDNGMGNRICYMCNEEKSGGIEVLGNYICRRCEEEMIRQDLDELKMEYYKNNIKSLWKNRFS